MVHKMELQFPSVLFRTNYFGPGSAAVESVVSQQPAVRPEVVGCSIVWYSGSVAAYMRLYSRQRSSIAGESLSFQLWSLKMVLG